MVGLWRHADRKEVDSATQISASSYLRRVGWFGLFGHTATSLDRAVWLAGGLQPAQLRRAAQLARATALVDILLFALIAAWVASATMASLE